MLGASVGEKHRIANNPGYDRVDDRFGLMTGISGEKIRIHRMAASLCVRQVVGAGIDEYRRDAFAIFSDEHTVADSQTGALKCRVGPCKI